MKHASMFETDLLTAVNKIQARLTTLENKIDSLIHHASAAPKPAAQTPPASNQRPQARPKYDAICADCQKQCTIPFKPSADRPVYCQDCFSRRKVISMSKISVPEKPIEPSVEPPQLPKVPAKKKKVAIKKAAAKKKTTTKGK